MKNNNKSSPHRLAVDFGVVKADYMIVSEMCSKYIESAYWGFFYPQGPRSHVNKGNLGSNLAQCQLLRENRCFFKVNLH